MKISGSSRVLPSWSTIRCLCVLVLVASLVAMPLSARAQAASGPDAAKESEVQELRALVKDLQLRLAALEKEKGQLEEPSSAAVSSPGTATAAAKSIAPEQVNPSGSANSVETTAAAPSEEQPKLTNPTPSEPFAFADFTWLNGNARTKEAAFDSKFFTPEIRADVSYIADFNRPADDTIGGSTEAFRANEIQLTQLGVGGDFHYDNVRARVMTQFGMYSTATPRNDASPARGQWDLSNAYRYISEAYGGYHFNALHGVNVDAGIFMSYIGLFSYYNFDNWAYQPSYVSSNTPWFFNGLRAQIFVTDKLKIEPWFINGWQSYGKFNAKPGLGGQILWRPTGWFSLVSNNYGLGTDTLNNQNRTRFHTDNSIQVKYYDRPTEMLDKMAFSLTGDAGCEDGGGVACFGNSVRVVNGQRIVSPKQSFLGFMLYNRFWFDKDRYGITLGGGKMNNPGRYLTLLPPINGATAFSGTPYFTANPGDPFKAWDTSATFDYMPSQYITFRWEYDYRAANVPYFTGKDGITPPGGNTGPLGSLVPGWSPDLRKDESRLNLALMVKF